MNIKKTSFTNIAVRLYIMEQEQEVGHAYLYLIKNDLHTDPYGLIEDVFVKEKFRGKGYGRKLIQKVLEVAKEKRCYKVILQSRYKNEEVHNFYKKIGFKDWGKNFRINISS